MGESTSKINTSDFDYELPDNLIAQIPIEPRDQSKLMVVSRQNGQISHHKFFQITDHFPIRILKFTNIVHFMKLFFGILIYY